MVAEGAEISIIDERVGDVLPDLSGVDYFMCSVFAGYSVSRAYNVSKWVKIHFPHVKVVWGGPFVSALPVSAFDGNIVDHVIQGDVDDGTYPLPYHLVDVEKYVNPETERAIYVTSYGCVGNCTFCQTTPRRKLVFLPYKRVEQDIDTLMGMHRFREMVFFDATLFTKPERAFDIALLMQKHGLNWVCDSRADEIIKLHAPDIASLIHCGLKQLTIGLESGSQRIINMMRKGKNHLEHFRQAAERLRQLPVKMVSGVIFGTPGETVDDLRQTIDYIREIREINPNFRVSSTFYKPLPDTAMAEMCEQYGHKPPQTLREWAEQGEQGHYAYNEYQPAPWIVGQEEYRRVYEQFRSEEKELFV
jgi:radical SAM superfamily enzyme YgiQ (UPF0313 family)